MAHDVKETDATVFVIDDDPSMREAIDSLIRSVGIRVRTFASAQEFMTRQTTGRARVSRARRAHAGVALQRRFEELTPREREVMEQVVAGLLNKQIANRLNISEVTVKLHRQQVMEKMKAHSLAEPVRMAEKLNAQQT